MPGILLRFFITMLGLYVASSVVPGVTYETPAGLLLAALLLGIVNAIVRPLVILLTLPVTVLTLGLFLLIVNAAMLSLVAWLLDDFHVDGFWPAVFGAILVSLTSMLASMFIGPKGKYEVMVIRRDID